jgi:hypothetical protein
MALPRHVYPARAHPFRSLHGWTTLRLAPDFLFAVGGPAYEGLVSDAGWSA